MARGLLTISACGSAVAAEPRGGTAGGRAGKHRAAPSRALTSQGAWLLADQVIFAITSLAVNVALARWLTREDYGLFATAYAALVLVSTIHSGLIAEPTLVFGTGKYRHDLAGYIRVVSRYHWLLILAFGGLTAGAVGVSILAGSGHLSQALAVLLCITPGFLSTAWVRRVCVVQTQSNRASLIGALYLAGVISAMYGLHISEALSPASAAGVLGSAGLLVWACAGQQKPTVSDISERTIRESHVHYGKWALVSSVAAWVPLNAQALLLPRTNGLEAVAAFRIFTQLIMPAAQFFMAAGTFLVPLFITLRPTVGIRKLTGWGLVFAAVLGVSYLSILAFAGPWILRALYGDTYADVAPLTVLAGAVPLFMGISIVMASAERAAERPSVVAKISGAAAIAALFATIPATAVWGVSGAAVALLFSQVVSAVLFLIHARWAKVSKAPAIAQALAATIGTRIIEISNSLLPKKERYVLHSFPDFDDNVLALYDRLFSDNEVIVLLSEFSGGPRPVGARCIKKNSFKGAWTFATSRYVFTTHGMFRGLKPQRRQVLINMWHGMPLKAIGHLDKDSSASPVASTAVVATSPYFQNVMSQCFGVTTDRVLLTGQPRTDRMIRASHGKLRRAFWGDAELRFRVLWLPTYRQSVRGEIRTDGRPQEPHRSNEEIRRLDAWCQRNDTVCLIKPHPMSVDYAREWDGTSVKVITDAAIAHKSVTLYDLVGTADILITDVSSVYVDYLLLQKPVIFVFPDRHTYADSRGWAVQNIEEWFAGPIVSDISGLVAALRDLAAGNDSYADARRRLAAVAHAHHDAHATDRLIAAARRLGGARCAIGAAV